LPAPEPFKNPVRKNVTLDLKHFLGSFISEARMKILLTIIFLGAAFSVALPDTGFSQGVEMRLMTNENLKKAREALIDGNMDRAIYFYKRALRRSKLTDSEKVSANTGLCAAYMSTEKYQEAIDHCEASLELNPNKWETLNNLGISYMGLKDYRMAIEILERGLKLNSDSDILQANLELAHQGLQEEEIRRQIELEKNPNANPDGEEDARQGKFPLF
jgi:tetratricopeptide (TPR) repeat protein